MGVHLDYTILVLYEAICLRIGGYWLWGSLRFQTIEIYLAAKTLKLEKLKPLGLRDLRMFGLRISGSQKRLGKPNYQKVYSEHAETAPLQNSVM